MTKMQAMYLRGITRLFWHKALYRTITDIESPRAAALALMSVNDSWLKLYEPVDLFLDQITDAGQLALSSELYESYGTMLADDPLPADLPQISHTDYLQVVVPMLPAWADLRQVLAEADMTGEEDFQQQLTPTQTQYKN
jgi:hypothetical protein